MLGSLIGSYRLTKKIGQGGMGAVYEAVHQTIERRVAIKVLKPELARNPVVAVRFINEARAVNLVNHPGIVQISDYGQLPDGTAYIVMELLEGETLGRRMLRHGGRLPVEQILPLVRQVTSALVAAHHKQIVHRDLKPDNVMLVHETDADAGERERVKLLDFGIAKVTSAPRGVDKEHTLADAVLGSPEYMSPEQCQGASSITDRADVYSLGVIMYRMLCGRLPFSVPASSALLAMHIYEKVPPLAEQVVGVPAQLVELVHRMLAKKAAERPSAQQVLLAIEQLALQLGMSTSSQALSIPRGLLQARSSELHRPSSTLAGAIGQTGPRRAMRRARIGGVAAALSVVVVGLTVSWWRPWPQARRGTVTQSATKSAAGPSSTGVAAAPEQAAAAKRHPTWTISSEPAGAQVVRDSDGLVLGVTPWQGEQPPGGEPVVVNLRLAGYRERQLTLQTGADASYSPTLSPKGRRSRGKALRGSSAHKQGKHGQPEIAD